MEKIALALNGVSAVASTLFLGALAFTLPSVWTLASDVGGVKATVASIDKKLEGIESKVDALTKRTDMIDMRLSAKESDPTLLLAQAGFRPLSEFGGVRVGEKLFVMPKSDKAALELASSGMKRENITASIFGWVVGTYDNTGRLRPISTGSVTEPRPVNSTNEQK